MPTHLYLDTNVLCRPFDNQRIRRIRRETEAFERIAEKIRDNEAVLVISEILLFEIQRILSSEKRAKVVSYLPLGRAYHTLTEETFSLAEEIVSKFRLDPRDALHVASALLEGADYFLSCDDGVTKRFRKQLLSVTIRGQNQSLAVMNPEDFLKKIGW